VSQLLLVVDFDGTVYRGDAPVRHYAGLISDTLAPARAKDYLQAMERYLESGPAAAAGSEDTVEAAALREAVDPWGAAAGLAARCHAVPADVLESAFVRSRLWMAEPQCEVELVESLLQTLADLRTYARTFLLTNSGYPGLHPFLARLGIITWFDVIVAQAGKPDGLRRLLQRNLGTDLRERPWRVFSIGDHYRNDIEPAAEIGAACGYIDRYGRADGPATATAAAAEDLLPALRAWAADPVAATRGRTLAVAYLEFWGGVGVIGSSKVLIGDGGHRVLLDLGLDIPREADLFRDPVRLRPGQELSARLRAGAAAPVPGVYDPAGLGSGDPLSDRLAEPGEPAAVFVSHPHIDHVGLAGFVRPDIGLYAAPETIALLGALAAGGDVLPGPRDFTAPRTGWVPIETGTKVRAGPMTVERFDLDHDVPGASGYRVTTSDGVLAYTGDIRFHGHHPERSWAFAADVADCDVLVTEGTSLGFDQAYPLRAEADVARDYAAALAGSPDLMLQAVYPRDLDRVRALSAVAAQLGRVICWPEQTAAFLRAAGIEAATADLAPMLDSPGSFVVQVDPGDLPSLLSLPLGAGSAVLHANGEPLGPFDPRWKLFTDWIAHCGLPLRQIGCSGHAYPDDLHEMVYRIRPKVVVPIHTGSPHRLHPVGGPARVVVGYGQRYDFAGRALPGAG
jgi:ribonuclease J